MKSEENLFYASCLECPFANFLDYKTVRCSRSVEYNPNKDCEEFKQVVKMLNQKIERKSSSLFSSAKEKNKIKEREESYIIDKLKEVESSQIVTIKNDKVANSGLKKSLFCINTKKECHVYDSPIARTKHLLRSEPKNKLIPFHRQVIRNSKEFIMIKEENGMNSYICDEGNNLDVCLLAEVNRNPLDIVLISHDTFNQSYDSLIIESHVVKEVYSKYINSSIVNKNGSTVIKIKDVIEKEGKTLTILNHFSLNQELPEIKIGRLLPKCRFYIIDNFIDENPRRIKLIDGTEGVLLSNSKSYTEQKTALEEFIRIVSIILTLSIVIIGIGVVLIETGWVIFFGILILPLMFIVKNLFSRPLHFILSQIIKRF